jgi:Flp pilus assembly protein TadG
VALRHQNYSLKPLGEYRQFQYDAGITKLILTKIRRLGSHMTLEFGFFSPRARHGKDGHASRPGLLARLLRNEDGSTIVYMTLAVPVLIGIAGLGSEGGAWLYKHRVVQSAADNAAYSAATAYIQSSAADITGQARAITANDYNLVNGVNGVTVTVNKPPAGGCPSATSNYTGANAIEVIVTQPQSPLFSSVSLSGTKNICGRAVAIIPNSGDCILALATTGTAITTVAKQNNLNVSLTNCSIFSNSTNPNSITMNGNNNTMTADAIGTAGGINLSGNAKSTIFNPTTGDPPVTDPYAAAAASWPTSGGTTQTNCPPVPKHGTAPPCTATLSPGTYATGIELPITGTTYTMSAGIYYVGGNFNITGNNITLNGTGVTIVLTGNNVFTLNGQNSVINLTAPTATGWDQGIAIWEPTSNGSNNFVGNSANVTITGVIYAPQADVIYTGNTGTSPTCTQIVAKTVEFGGNSINLTGNCSSAPGVKVFGQIAALVE